MRLTVPSERLPGSFLCPVDVPVTVLGGKWKLLIVYFLLQGPHRNGELRRLLPGISQKVLTQQLRELESDAIVVRTVFDQVPPRVDYSICAGERTRLDTLVQALFDWGVSWATDRGAHFDDGGETAPARG